MGPDTCRWARPTRSKWLQQQWLCGRPDWRGTVALGAHTPGDRQPSDEESAMTEHAPTGAPLHAIEPDAESDVELGEPQPEDVAGGDLCSASPWVCDPW